MIFRTVDFISSSFPNGYPEKMQRICHGGKESLQTQPTYFILIFYSKAQRPETVQRRNRPVFLQCVKAIFRGGKKDKQRERRGKTKTLRQGGPAGGVSRLRL
jgi:hypothetical protein